MYLPIYPLSQQQWDIMREAGKGSLQPLTQQQAGACLCTIHTCSAATISARSQPAVSTSALLERGGVAHSIFSKPQRIGFKAELATFSGNRRHKSKVFCEHEETDGDPTKLVGWKHANAFMSTSLLWIRCRWRCDTHLPPLDANYPDCVAFGGKRPGWIRPFCQRATAEAPTSVVNGWKWEGPESRSEFKKPPRRVARPHCDATRWASVTAVWRSSRAARGLIWNGWQSVTVLLRAVSPSTLCVPPTPASPAHFPLFIITSTLLYIVAYLNLWNHKTDKTCIYILYILSACWVVVLLYHFFCPKCFSIFVHENWETIR